MDMLRRVKREIKRKKNVNAMLDEYLEMEDLEFLTLFCESVTLEMDGLNMSGKAKLKGDWFVATVEPGRYPTGGHYIIFSRLRRRVEEYLLENAR